MGYPHSIKVLTGLLLVGLVAMAAPAANAEQEPAATPYRPTVSNPADLSEPGWLEVEFGGQHIMGGSGKRLDSFPVLAKLAFTEDWGILLGGDLGVRYTDVDGVLYKGAGDTTLTLKQRIPTAAEGAAWGVEAGCKFPTAKTTIGSGKADYILNGIYSRDFSDNHLDLSLGVTRAGAVSDDGSRYLYNWAASLSRNLGQKWGVFGELSGLYPRGMPALSQVLAGANYNFSKRVVFDAGGTVGLTNASQDWSVFAGVTVLMGQLW
ncbi:MAG: hypothetical protein ACYC0P_11195 [Thiobacillus sp.]